MTVRDDLLKDKKRPTRSCGCLQKEAAMVSGKNNHVIKYGDSSSRLYNIWYQMRVRCNNEKSEAYKYYGGRGISVCDEWNHPDTGYIEFKKWALSNGYDKHLTIDRIDNNGIYSPTNCRWVTAKEQNNNKRNTIIITYNNDTHTLSEWSQLLGIDHKTLWNRLNLGWNIKDVLFKPVRKNTPKNVT